MADDNDTWYTTELALGVGSTLAPEKPKYPFGCDGPVLIKPTTEQLLAGRLGQTVVLMEGLMGVTNRRARERGGGRRGR